jgi:hypothetical protein
VAVLKMSTKPIKSSPVKAVATAKSERAAKVDPTEKTRRPKGEGPDNLRQRAEWFRRRTSGAGEK